MLAVPGGQIWYKVSGSGGGTPVVLLHGGPGFSSFYMKPFEDLGDSRIVVRYDQLGGGKSTRITDTTMMTIPHFVAELDSLRAFLKIPRWHVVGHSWGTILALEYYRAHPDRVASLTFASPVFDIPAYAAHARELIATLSDSAQRAIARGEASGKFDDPSYQNAINEFYGRYVFRHPVQADLDSTFATVNEAIYGYMQGPSEFTITGTLKDYNARNFLPTIKVPVQWSHGEFDEVGADLVQSYADSLPGSINWLFYGAAHITPWDAHDEIVRKVREFLWQADSAQGNR
jgi:proline iminopeptidase